MPEFGLPRRSVIEDANNGVVNPPAKRASVRQVAGTQDGGREIPVGPDLDKLQTINNLTNALQNKIKNKQSNIIEQRRTDAAIRQGHNVAINELDKLNERTGWQEFVFGQDVSYRAAQQRAVENNVNREYIKQATMMDQFAGDSPEEYAARLKADLDVRLKPFQDDPETKQLISNAWQVHSMKLAAKHYEVNYAYTQEQNRITEGNRIQLAFDTWTVDEGSVYSEEQRDSINQQQALFFEGRFKPDNMSQMAWNSVVNEQLMTSLRQGNIGAYKAAEKNGWLSKLNVAEQTSMDRALSAYDTDFSQSVALAYENAELAALQVKDLDEAAGVYVDLQANIENLAKRSSGTERAELALTRGNIQAEQGFDSVDDAIAKMEKERVALKLKMEKEEDSQFTDRIDLIYETARNEALERDTVEGAFAAYDKLHESLNGMAEFSSGRDPVETHLMKAHNKEELRRRELEAIAEKARQAALKAQKEQTDFDALKEAHRITDPIKRSGRFSQLQPTKKDSQLALDMTIMEDVSRLSVSEEPLDEIQTVQVLMSNPQIAKKIATRLNNSHIDSPLVKGLFDTFINGISGLQDEETGQINDTGKAALASLAQFAANEGSFINTIGVDNFDKYEILTRGITVGSTFEQINKQLESYDAYKGNKGEYAINWKLGKQESKRDRIQSLVKDYGGGIPEGPVLGQYLEDYNRALVMYQGDISSANDYLRKTVQNTAITYNNQSIIGGKELDTTTNYSFQDLMNGAQTSAGEASMLTPYLATLGVRVREDNKGRPDGKPLKSIDQVKDLHIYTQPNIGGFFIDSPDALAPVYISDTVMKRWATELDQRKRIEDLRKEREQEMYDERKKNTFDALEGKLTIM